MKISLALLCVALLAGCRPEYKARVESDTSWSGFFGNRTVDGTGNRVVNLPDDVAACVAIHKSTETGFLRLRIEGKGGWFLDPARDSDPVETTADHGIVTACVEGNSGDPGRARLSFRRRSLAL